MSLPHLKKRKRFWMILLLGILIVIGILLVLVVQLSVRVLPSSSSTKRKTTTTRNNQKPVKTFRSTKTEPAAATTTKCTDARRQQDFITSSTIQQQPPLNVTGKGLCFIHVGKTGGGSFRKQFANEQKWIKHPSSIPELEFWKEFHTDSSKRWLTKEWYTRCDYFVAWVRDPIERAISAYNMVFDPNWIEPLRQMNSRRYSEFIQLQNRTFTFASLFN